MIADVKHSQSAPMHDWQDAAFRGLLSSVDGRRALAVIIMDMARLGASSFSDSDRIMAYREGERNVGTKVLERIRSLDPDAWIKIQTERISDERSSRQANGH